MWACRYRRDLVSIQIRPRRSEQPIARRLRDGRPVHGGNASIGRTTTTSRRAVRSGPATE